MCYIVTNTLHANGVPRGEGKLLIQLTLAIFLAKKLECPSEAMRLWGTLLPVNGKHALGAGVASMTASMATTTAVYAQYDSMYF